MTERRMTVGALAAAGCLLLAMSSGARAPTKLLFNTTVSAPIGFYSVSQTTPMVGDLVVIDPPGSLAAWMARRGYLPLHVPLLKVVAAAGGAHVCGAAGIIMIDHAVVGRALDRDRWGRRLSPFKGCRTLQTDEVFLFNAGSVASLDSRYFGPLDRRQIVGVAHPLWTWER